MLINNANLRTLYVAFNAAFKEGLGMAESQYGQIATTVPSTTAAEEYGWLGNTSSMREWLGDRVVHAVGNHGYTIKNKSFELTQAVPRTAIEDDTYGVYTPMMTEMGRAAQAHPDQLVFGLLKDGFTAKCYDGQAFFADTHPVINDKGKEVAVSNKTGNGSGTVWCVLDTSRALKPLIYQSRKDNNFVSLTAETDDNVFNRAEYVYGVDARRNAGFGFWQLARASNATLDVAGLQAEITAMRTLKGDHGRPLGIKPTLLVVPPALEFQARKLLEAELALDPVSGQPDANPMRGAVELLVADWL